MVDLCQAGVVLPCRPAVDSLPVQLTEAVVARSPSVGAEVETGVGREDQQSPPGLGPPADVPAHDGLEEGGGSDLLGVSGAGDLVKGSVATVTISKLIKTCASLTLSEKASVFVLRSMWCL